MRGATYLEYRRIHGPQFQSTLPMRGATHHPRSPGGPGNFNPRSPCGERQRIRMVQAAALAISIHAPHAGSDRRLMTMATTKGDFNPRSPCGERHKMEGENKDATNFNPRSPCGERLAQTCTARGLPRFQSTLPMRGATSALFGIPLAMLFQSTLPMRGAT